MPNGQVANATLENLSARDKFRLLHTVRLERATTAAQLRTVLDEITAMLSKDSRIERETVRVRFVGIAAFSLNVEVMAHVFAPGMSEFLEVQEAVLLRIMEIVQEAGRVSRCRRRRFTYPHGRTQEAGRRFARATRAREIVNRELTLRDRSF